MVEVKGDVVAICQAGRVLRKACQQKIARVQSHEVADIGDKARRAPDQPGQRPIADAFVIHRNIDRAAQKLLLERGHGAQPQEAIAATLTHGRAVISAAGLADIECQAGTGDMVQRCLRRNARGGAPDEERQTGGGLDL